MTQIIGIMLVRNEDRFVAWALNNAAAFCDRFIILDNQSRDKTCEKLLQFQRKHPDVEIHTIKDIGESHAYVAPFAGADCWVMGLDGDEIYDPAGLEALKGRLCSGEFQKYWSIHGNVLHCERLDPMAGMAYGYLSPPSRPMTKLYNFTAIKSWEGHGERLHAGGEVFREGCSAESRLKLHQQVTWAKSEFRCLHLCFMSRSSLDIVRDFKSYARLTPSDRMKLSGWRSLIEKWWPSFYRSKWKLDHYHKGACVGESLTPFIKGELLKDKQGILSYCETAENT